MQKQKHSKSRFYIRALVYGAVVLLALTYGLLNAHAQKGQRMETASQTSVIASPCTSNNSGKLLLVSLSQQHIWACDNHNLVKQSAVTTGRTQVVNGVDDATPTGSWQITSKETNRHLRGADTNGSWDDAVKYWIPFDGDIGFHDASWQTFPYGSSQYRTDGSHGCVHLPLDMMAWVYEWANVGTDVTIEV